jgi:serpin B
MDRRAFLSLLAVPAVAQLLQACGSDGSSDSPPDATGPASFVQSGLTRTAAEPAQAVDAATALDAFGFDLYQRLLAAQPDDNLVFSPASIAIALTMTAAGARGTTLDEMLTVLHITDSTTIHRSMNALTAALDARTRTETDAEGNTNSVRLAIANSLWGQRDLSFTREFLDLLAAEYGAGMHLVDYRNDTEGARTAINAWVSDATEQRIPELLQQGVLARDSKLTLVNAIYLKAQWSTAFDETATRDEPFTTSAGATVTVPMMHLSEMLPYASGSGWQAVEVPYVFGELVLTIALPDAGAEAPPLADVVAALAPQQVQLGMPRFDVETATELGAVLADMGMATAFSDQADFSGMSSDVALQIAKVVHQANITTDETGTEAAAATAVVMRPTSAPGEQVVLTLDRPFVFALRDQTTGAVLFLGRVADPTQRR